MTRKVINLTHVYHIERIKPNCSDHSFGFEFFGASPGGHEVNCKIILTPNMFAYLANHMHQQLWKYQEWLAEAQKAMKGNL